MYEMLRNYGEFVLLGGWGILLVLMRRIVFGKLCKESVTEGNGTSRMRKAMTLKFEKSHEVHVEIMDIPIFVQKYFSQERRLDFLHTFTDIVVVHPFLFRNGVVIADRRETVDTKIFFNGTKVKVKQFFEYGEICFCKMIDGTVIGTYLLTGHAEIVFIGQQDEGQIIVPQIFVEAILGRKIEERFHLLIDPAGQIFFFCEIKFIVAEDAGQL